MKPLESHYVALNATHYDMQGIMPHIMPHIMNVVRAHNAVGISALSKPHYAPLVPLETAGIAL